MPWCEIPPQNIQHLTLFDFQILHEDGELVWVEGPKDGVRKKMAVERACPRVWFEDMSDARQAGATAILQHPD